MTPSGWARVSDLLAGALELPAAERSAILVGEDESVRREVERLLREHDSSGGMLDRPLFAMETEKRLWTGQVLKDRYRIERFLARGGAGAVYLARDEHIAGRAVVVKFLHAWARDYVWLKDRFRLEMEALARIDDRGVVGVLDAGETADGLPFLVVEYIDGATLRSEIAKGPLDIARASRLILQIARAVQAAHDKGVMHRDLKPENIMLERPGAPEETVRLIDFGIARVDSGIEASTHATQFCGTTPYMSPEQLAGKPRPASDTYALGVIAYEMLSGRRPFTALSPVELYEQQRAGIKTGPRRHRPEIPQPAERAIRKQLSFRPEDRGASALEAGEQIAAALLGRSREPWSRRRAAAVLFGGGAVGAVAPYVWRGIEDRPLDSRERVIEMVMGTEPLEHGFTKDLSLDYHVLPNAAVTGVDSMRVTSTDQGAYFRPLSAAQSRSAHRNGWKMIMEGAIEEGSLNCGVDNPRDHTRYNMALIRNAGGPDQASCLLIAAPEARFLLWPVPGPAGARHRLVLAASPGEAGADLWVDGVRAITGYHGSPDFRYNRGLMFGASCWRGRRASGVFWRVRLEILA